MSATISVQFSMDQVEAVRQEVSRIVDSPYAVSLKAFDNILHTVAPNAVQYWADCTACQIDPLASAVLQGLELWPYTLNILRILSSVVPIRDAFIRQKPLLLPELLGQATTAAGVERYEARHSRILGTEFGLNVIQVTRTCVSLLSLPLPNGYPAPAALPAFALQLLEDAVKHASAATLRPLYLLIKGVGTHLLGILPPSKLDYLQLELIKLLRKLEDHSANLLCLAVFAAMHTDVPLRPGTEDVRSSQDYGSCMGSTLPQTQDVYHLARQFFGPKKAPKTLDLIILRAILSCSGASEMNPAQAVESLKLARKILEAVDSSERAVWVQSNTAKVRKLLEKVRYPDVDLGVRLAGIALISSLMPVSSIPNDVITAIERLLDRPLNGHNMEEVTRAFAPCFSDDFILVQFTRALGAATECGRSGVDAIIEINDMNCLVRCLKKAAKSSSSIRQTLLVALSSNKLQPVFQKFITTKSAGRNTAPAHGRHGTCPVQIEESRLRLQQEICHLLLRCAFYASSLEVAMDPAIATALLKKASATGASGGTCQAFGFEPQSRFAAPHVLGISDRNPAYRSDQDWKTLLKAELDLDSAFRHKLVVRGVESVCRDLEARCNGVERPLNEERERARLLHNELDRCKKLYAELESKTDEQTLVLDSLQAEHSHLVVQNQMTEERIQSTSDSLEVTREQLRIAHEDTMSIASDSKDVTRRQELEYLANLAAKDELLETEAFKVISLEKTIVDLDKMLLCAREENLLVHARLADTLTTLSERDALIEELRQSLRNSEMISEHQITAADQVRAELHSLKQEILNLRSEADTMKAEKERKIQELMLQASESLQEFELEIATRHSNISCQKSQYEKTIARFEIECNTAKTECSRLKAENEVKVADLVRQMDKLNWEREIRAKEFAEAQDLSSKLMVLMGKGTGQSIVQAGSKSPPVYRPHGRTGVGSFGVATGTLDRSGHQTAAHHSSSSSVTSLSGSTPKRARAGRGSKNPSAQQMKLNSRYKTNKSSDGELRKLQRQPLTDIKVNGKGDYITKSTQDCEGGYDYEPADQGATKQAKIAEEEQPLQPIRGASFHGSSMFTSTNYHQLDTRDWAITSGIYDETTVDL